MKTEKKMSDCHLTLSLRFRQSCNRLIQWQIFPLKWIQVNTKIHFAVFISHFLFVQLKWKNLWNSVVILCPPLWCWIFEKFPFRQQMENKKVQTKKKKRVVQRSKMLHAKEKRRKNHSFSTRKFFATNSECEKIANYFIFFCSVTFHIPFEFSTSFYIISIYLFSSLPSIWQRNQYHSDCLFPLLRFSVAE